MKRNTAALFASYILLCTAKLGPRLPISGMLDLDGETCFGRNLRGPVDDTVFLFDSCLKNFETLERGMADVADDG